MILITMRITLEKNLRFIYRILEQKSWEVAWVWFSWCQNKVTVKAEYSCIALITTINIIIINSMLMNGWPIDIAVRISTFEKRAFSSSHSSFPIFLPILIVLWTITPPVAREQLLRNDAAGFCPSFHNLCNSFPSITP